MIRLARYASTARKLVSDNSPAILTAVAVVGVATTVVLAVRATPQAWIDVQNEKSERTDEVTPVDIVKLTYIHYLPAITSGSITIAAIVMSNRINSKRTAALASAYGITELAFREYQNKVVEHIGAPKEQKVRDEVNAEAVQKASFEPKNIIITGNGTQMFLDKLSGQLFESDVESVRKAVNDINYKMFNESYASLNDFYYALGADQNAIGEELGWTADRPLELEELTAEVRNGRAVLVINYRVIPKRKYNKFG